jgi:DNA-binding transcriptional LysR family regulator
MRDALPLQGLQVFLAVARQRGFTRAAREMGITPSAVSQAVRLLEERLGVPLLARTTRSVALTEAGRVLVEQAGPGLAQASAALGRVAAGEGELVGSLRLTAPAAAVPLILSPILPRFLARHPRVAVEVSVDDRLLDLVQERFDAGIRFAGAIQQDMVRVTLTEPLRFVIVGAPAYLRRAGTPRTPRDLLRHQCINYRSSTTGTLYVWDLEQGRKRWRVPVQGPVIANEPTLMQSLAEAGCGLAYLLEAPLREALRAGTLESVLERFVPPGEALALYFPERARLSPILRAFVDVARAASPRSAGRARTPGR